MGNILIWKVTIRDGDIPPSVNKVDQVVVELMEAALSNARNEMDALIQRYVRSFLSLDTQIYWIFTVAMSPAMREQVNQYPAFLTFTQANVDQAGLLS